MRLVFSFIFLSTASLFVCQSFTEKRKMELDSMFRAYPSDKIDSVRIANLTQRAYCYSDLGDTVNSRKLMQEAWSLIQQTSARNLKNKKYHNGYVSQVLCAAQLFVIVTRQTGNAAFSKQVYETIIQQWKLAGEKEALALATLDFGQALLQNFYESEAALKYLNESLILFHQSGNKRKMIAAYSLISSAQFKIGNYPRALKMVQEYQRLAIEVNDSDLIISSRIAMANAYKQLGDFEEARQNLLVTLPYYETAWKIEKDPGKKKVKRDKIGKVYMLLGINYYYLDSLEQAIESHNRSIAINIEIDNWQHHTMELNNIALVYMKQGRIDLAIKNQLEAITIRHAHNDLDGETWYLNALGDFLNERKMYDSALVYFIKAIKNIEVIKNPDYEFRARYGMAEAWLQKGNTRKAKEEAMCALELSKRTAATQKQMEVCELLDRINFELRDYLSAYRYHKQYVVLRDSMSNEEKQKEIGRLESEYEWEKKMIIVEKENAHKSEVAENNLKQQRFIIYGGTFLLVLTVIFTMFAVRRWKITQRQKGIIEKQKQVVDEKNKEITDSIVYARRIQRALITSEYYIEKAMKRLNK